MEQFWHHKGWAIRQPAVEPVVDCMDMTDVATELARRTGLLAEYESISPWVPDGAHLSSSVWFGDVSVTSLSVLLLRGIVGLLLG